MRTASVSRLESFAACPFAHFLRYGLKPEIVEPYALTPRDEGVFFHAAVRGFLDEAMADGDFDPDRADARMERVAETLLAPLREGPLGQSARTRAEERRLKNVARTAARLLTEQLADTQFRPVGLEVRFGPDDGSACLRVGAGKTCALYGSIDRVDLWEGEKPYVRVLDYKRGSRPFDLAEAYAGLQLQLLVYLAAAAKRRGALAAGAFYFRMDEGYVLTPETDPAAVAELRRKALRMDGPMVDEEAASAANSAEPKRFYKASAPLTRAGLTRLLDRAVAMAGRHVDGICAGEAAPAPAKVGKALPCRFCDRKPRRLPVRRAGRPRPRAPRGFGQGRGAGAAGRRKRRKRNGGRARTAMNERRRTGHAAHRRHAPIGAGRTRFHMPGHKGRLEADARGAGHDRAALHGRPLRPARRASPRPSGCWQRSAGRARPSSCPAAPRRASSPWCWPLCGRAGGF